MATTATLSVHWRWLIRRDNQEVLDIEQHAAIPWLEDELLDAMRARDKIGMVGEYKERVIAWGGYRIGKDRMDVFRLIVAPAFRRRGVASGLINVLKSKLGSHQKQTLRVEVSERELAMHLFLRDAGFKAKRVIREGAEDGHDSYRFEFRNGQKGE